MKESGVGGGARADGGEVVTLTTEEYEKMVKEGKIIPINQSEGFIDGPPTEVVEPVKDGEEISEEEYQRLIREGHILPDEITEDDETPKEESSDEESKIEQDAATKEKDEL